MQALIGQSIDRYQISAQLAEDRSGAIYKAYDPKFDRTVTLYLINLQVAKQSRLDEYILQAARTILTWRHAGLARLYDFGKRPDSLYVVQEFIPGPDLRQLLKDLRAADSWVELGEAVLA
jgi:serine/threonine protein kinase